HRWVCAFGCCSSKIAAEAPPVYVEKLRVPGKPATFVAPDVRKTSHKKGRWCWSSARHLRNSQKSSTPSTFRQESRQMTHAFVFNHAPRIHARMYMYTYAPLQKHHILIY
ncbi:hypothetical protein TGARI_371830, partial [Toxoplasma gondii ARI]